MIENAFMQRIRRLLAASLILVMVLTMTVSTPVQAAKLAVPSGLEAHAALEVIDAYSGQVLIRENGTKKVYPGSTVKLMTAIVLLEQAKKKGISLSAKIRVTSKVLNQVESDLTNYNMEAGEVYTLRTLMNMILISSYGDATYVAANAVFGSVSSCIKAMNAKAKELGLTKTSFDNVAGLDIGNDYRHTYTTAKEMAKITQYAMKNSTIAGIVAKAYFQVNQADGTRGRRITTTNKFYTTVGYDSDLYTIVGSKTGTTAAAGYVFAATAVDDAGHKVISVYMGRSTTNARFTDTAVLLRTVFTAVKNGGIPLRTATTYPLYLKGNGSTEGSMGWITCTYNKNRKLPKNTYKRSGYTFIGWNTKKNGSGTAYTGGARVNNLIDETKAYAILYAQWKIREYDLAYQLDGGENAPENPAVYTVKDEIELAAPTRDGFIFDGWFTDKEFAEDSRITGITKGSTGKIYLYAKWIPVETESQAAEELEKTENSNAFSAGEKPADEIIQEGMEEITGESPILIEE